MIVLIRKSSLRRWIRWARKHYPNEVGGFLAVDDDGLVSIYPIARDKYEKDFFMFSVPELMALAKGFKIVGVIHTHCYSEDQITAEPSEKDWDMFEWLASQLPMEICAVSSLNRKRSRTRFWKRPGQVRIKRV